MYNTCGKNICSSPMISIKTIAVLKGLELRIEEPCDLVHRGFLGFFQERLVKDYTELTWSVTD